MNASSILAVIDTSAIIQLREERYAPEVFPSLNKMVEQLAKQGELITVDRVVDELAVQYSTGDDHADARGRTMDWTESLMSQPYDFDPFNAMIHIGNLTAEIANQHQDWQNGKPADPMVIAAAEYFGCSVVSGETRRVMDADNPKPISGSGQIWNPDDLFSSWIRIPDICLMRGIPHLDLLAFFRSQHWSF